MYHSGISGLISEMPYSLHVFLHSNLPSVSDTAPTNHLFHISSKAKTNVTASVHFTDDDVSFYDGPGMLIRKTSKPCINSM